LIQHVALAWRGLDRATPSDTRNPSKQEMLKETLSCLEMAIPGLACQHLKGVINDPYNDQLDMYSSTRSMVEYRFG